MNQAEKIIKKFGTNCDLARLIPRSRVTVWRWTQPKEKGGTDGVIPTQSQILVRRAAEENDIKLTWRDWEI